MTPENLRAIMPAAGVRADLHADAITAALQEFSITTAKRQAAFVANVAHETGQLLFMRELGSGVAYEPSGPGQPVNQRAIDLGNDRAGDGQRFRGGGDLQLTGRRNYDACGNALGIKLVDNPSLIEVPIYAARSGGWFWATHGLNELADGDKFVSVIKRINGGTNGGDERVAFWLAARKELGL